MRKNTASSRLIALALSLAIVLALACSLLAMAAYVPAPAEVKSGVTVLKNSKAEVDASNLAEGFVSVKYTGGKSVKIKAQVIKTGGTTYTYNLNNTGAAETFPLTEGDGEYTIRVLENTTGTKYAAAYSCKVELKLRSEFSPFLYSNQYVNYTADTAAVKKAAELVKDKTTTFDKMEVIYRWVIGNLTYNTDLANQVAAGTVTGYLPDLDKVMESKKGICFDYASMMAAMLRSQGIPCKLVVGYAGKSYHAWINVYVEGTGWIDGAIRFDGVNWTLMDPTFASSAKSSPSILKYIGDGANYTQKYAY